MEPRHPHTTGREQPFHHDLVQVRGGPLGVPGREAELRPQPRALGQAVLVVRHDLDLTLDSAQVFQPLLAVQHGDLGRGTGDVLAQHRVRRAVGQHDDVEFL
ncbi:hypothetical protein [Lentzea flava]|uniref:Uncharacterized protein n=1 Tax=Lentzea flava TaxID=103732 RepID=A0ABQ2UAP0_9PSEU|nr:hypothetical protein [Lentzea flava]GGU17107.1 hypothetical protein GCM10010178_06120 [Lentzea flava]